MHNTSNPEADGLQQQKPHQVLLLSPKNRKRKLQFTQAHQNWTIEDWKNVAWSDESRFLLWYSDGRVRIWCKEHESMDPTFLVSMVQAGGGGVMVWGIFSWHTLGPLVPIEHRLNATAYLSIVADHVLPFMTTVDHLLMATSSRIMHHVTKLKSS
uniref:Transposable element Tc1 transposase n=1 Tax=Cyprinus carpio carpio TaxID=630221 RepID=A0A9J8C660_CYPCA